VQCARDVFIMNVCVIPARGGSKRIPKKNIKDFNGKPIIAYSIEAALQAGCFDRIIVSTDNKEIAKISIDYGCEVPFFRPEELSDDYSGTVPVIKHAIEWFESAGELVDNVCCLYATAPFVQPNFILQALQKLKDLKSDYCFSVTDYRFPVQRSVHITDLGCVEMLYPEHFNTRSQDLEKVYHDAGQFYWGRAQAFKEERSLFSSNSVPYILPSYLVQDIDTLEDWIRAEAMYRSLRDLDAL